MIIPANVLSETARPAATALLVAAVAGAFSLTGLLITKEQKVSEFRQAWIDALRSDIALYVATVSILLAHIETLDSLDKVKLLEETRDDYLKLNESAMRIKLRLNSEETESEPVLRSMSAIERLMNSDFSQIRATSEVVRESLNTLEKKAPHLLKTEWNRVKRGEPMYRFAKWFAAVVLMAAGGCAIWLLLS
jgi:hypothetical protein